MSNALGCLVGCGFVLMITACASSEAGKEVHKAKIDKSSVLEAQMQSPNEYPLQGAWKIEEAKSNGRGQWVNQEYRFTQNRFELVQTIALDQDFKKIQLVHRIEGIYQLIPQAQSNYLNMQITASYLKHVKGSKSLKSLGVQECQLKPGQEILLDTKSCGNFMSIKECGQSFDIVKINASSIELGDKKNSIRTCAEKDRPSIFGERYRKIH